MEGLSFILCSAFLLWHSALADSTLNFILGMKYVTWNLYFRTLDCAPQAYVLYAYFPASSDVLEAVEPLRGRLLGVSPCGVKLFSLLPDLS